MSVSILCARVSVTVRRLMSAENGTIAILFGLLLAILLGSAGFAIDYTRIARAKQRAQATLDAASLAAVQKPTLAEATQTFEAYLHAQDNIEGSAQLKAKIDSFDGVTLKSSGDVVIPMTLSAAVGLETTDVKVKSAAKTGSGYQEFYFALDLSASMGVAATAADRTALEQLTKPYTDMAYGTLIPQGCAFGCHNREGWEPGTKTVYEMARDAGIQLREDELIHQFGGLVDLFLDPADPAVAAGMRKISVTAFSGHAQQLITPSSSATDVKSVLNSFPKSSRNETRFANALQELESIVGTQGAGTKTAPQKTIILITDGIESMSAYFAQSPINSSLCNSIKNNGFRLAVVELKYPQLPSNAIYNDTVLPVETEISPALEACASPGWHFQATFNSDIPIKFNELRDRLFVASARLTE